MDQRDSWFHANSYTNRMLHGSDVFYKYLKLFVICIICNIYVL